MKKIVSLLILIPLFVFSQKKETVYNKLIGNWEGAFIKNNSYQKIEIEITERNKQLFGLQIMDEWHPTFGEFEVPIEIDEKGKISFGTGYGKANVVLDDNNLEITGNLVNFNPVIYLHLKKIPRKPNPNFVLEKVNIKSEDVQLSGHLHNPLLNHNKSAIIIVGGRGCYADATQYNLYAKVLRSYGIAVLAYQKRGNGSSTGNCNLATIEDLANDIVAAKLFLENHKSNFKNIGVLGISAGGWVMAKAEEKTNFDFMISIVGPATSVKEQQLQSASYGAKFYNLNSTAKSNLLTYTNLLFDAKPSQKSFNEMQNLLEISKKEGWDKLLETTDIAKNQDDIKHLWVRRHNYNPKNVLENFNKPFLGIYGDRDWIVPQQENINLLKTYFKNNIDNLTTINAYNAEHGMEMEAKYISLDNNKSYWHFYRISPEVRINIVDFLYKHKFI